MALAPPVLGAIIWTIICGAVIILVNVAKLGRFINKDNAGCVLRAVGGCEGVRGTVGWARAVTMVK